VIAISHAQAGGETTEFGRNFLLLRMKDVFADTAPDNFVSRSGDISPELEQAHKAQ